MRDHDVYAMAVEPDDIAPHVRDLEEAVREQGRYDPAVTVQDGRVELRTGEPLQQRDRDAAEELLDDRLDTGDYRSAMLVPRVSWPDPSYELVID